jgi:hypothetical protein
MTNHFGIGNLYMSFSVHGSASSEVRKNILSSIWMWQRLPVVMAPAVHVSITSITII